MSSILFALLIHNIVCWQCHLRICLHDRIVYCNVTHTYTFLSQCPDIQYIRIIVCDDCPQIAHDLQVNMSASEVQDKNELTRAVKRRKTNPKPGAKPSIVVSVKEKKKPSPRTSRCAYLVPNFPTL